MSEPPVPVNVNDLQDQVNTLEAGLLALQEGFQRHPLEGRVDQDESFATQATARLEKLEADNATQEQQIADLMHAQKGTS